MTSVQRERAFTMIEVLVVIIIVGVLISLLLPAVQSAREQARRARCSNNLAQIGLAAKSFEEARGLLPSGGMNGSGLVRNIPVKPPMGWLPQLLPYLEQEPLYRAVDFSTDPYSETNQPITMGRMMSRPSLNRVLACPSDRNAPDSDALPYNISYMGCQGGKETPIDVDNDGLFFLDSRLGSRDIPDGTTDTVFFGEAIVMPSDWTYRYYNNTANRIWERQFLKLSEAYPDEAENITPCLLGWMTGTGATLRNTGSPVNASSGPLAVNSAFHDWVGENFAQTGPRFDGNSESSSEEEPPEEVKKSAPIPAEKWAVPHPNDYRVGGFSSFHVYGANFLMADGSCRFIGEMIELSVYQKLGNRRDTKPGSAENGD